MGDGQKRVRAMSTAIYTIVAEAPGALVARLAFPVTAVGEGVADVAEDACFESLRRIGWRD